MNRVSIMLVLFLLYGCYTTLTSVVSSYDTSARSRVDRNQQRHYEISPQLLLNENLSLVFTQTPSRPIAPMEKECQEAMSNQLTMVLLSNGNFSLNIAKSVIAMGGDTIKIKSYRTFDDKSFRKTFDAPFLVLKKTPINVVKYSAIFNTEPSLLREKFNVQVEDVNGIEIFFERDFSCGENYYELLLFVLNNDSGKEGVYKVYFFPWENSITPH